MNEVIFTTIVLTVGLMVHFAILKQHVRWEGQLLTLSFFAHIVSGFVQIYLYGSYYSGGDMLSYYTAGVPLSEALRSDFQGVFPLTVEAFFHVETQLPYDLVGGGSTGTMSIAAVWLLYLLGDSYFAACLVVAIFSYFAKVFIYRSFRGAFQPEDQPSVLVACLLVPSAVFWTSALLKEPVMMVFLGPLFVTLRWFLEGRRLVLAAVLAAVSATGVWLLKPYVLLSFVVAAGLWVIWQRVLIQRGSVVVKPVYLVLGMSLGLGGLVAADRFLPRAEGTSLSATITNQRRASSQIEGGSNYYLEDQGTAESVGEADPGLAAQLALAPLALGTALFRPFLFEARNAVQVVNSLEMTGVIFLVVQVFRRQSISSVIGRLTASPALMFCLAFTIILALGTGLSTSNLGTLSRYRAPMMPFFVLLLLMLRRPSVTPSRSPTGSPAHRDVLPRPALGAAGISR
jgi:hypothetical protein